MNAPFDTDDLPVSEVSEAKAAKINIARPRTAAANRSDNQPRSNKSSNPGSPAPTGKNKDNMRAIILPILQKICEDFDLPPDRAEKAYEILVADELPPHTMWRQRTGEDLNLSPPDFIKKHYSDEISKGILTQAYVKRCDRNLYTAFHNWIQFRKRTDKPIDIGFPFPSAHKPREEEFAGRYGKTAHELLALQRKLDADRTKARRQAQMAASAHPGGLHGLK